MSTPAKKSAAKKAAPKKAAAKKAAAKKSAPAKKSESKAVTHAAYEPKNGEYVELESTIVRRGFFQDGKITTADGVTFPASGKLRKPDLSGLSDGDKQAIQNEQLKYQVFSEAGIPPHHQGENIHEKNNDLSRSINLGHARQLAKEKAAEIGADKTITGQKADELINEQTPHLEQS